MHNVNLQKREIRLGSRTLSIETGKLAKQADGSVIVRSGDTMVLVTACHAASPREGIDFLPLTVDYREYTYAVGPYPRRVLQARRQAAGKGNSHQPADRSSDPAAVRRRLALRDADHRDAALGRHRQRRRRPGDHRRLRRAGAVGDAAREDDRRRPRRHAERQLRHQPDPRRAQAEHARPDRRRQQRRHRDGGSRRQGSQRAGGRRRARSRARRDQADRRGHRRTEGRRRQEEADRQRQAHRCGLPQRRRIEDVRTAGRSHADQGQARKLRHRRRGAQRVPLEPARR